MEHEAGVDAPQATDPAGDPPDTQPPAKAAHGDLLARHETRLRRLMGRAAPYPGEILAVTQGWVSRDSSLHVFAARFFDFAVLTPEHLVFCSTGFFSRRPNRRVFREPLNRLVVAARGSGAPRTLRLVGDFRHPLLLQLPDSRRNLAFARELLDLTQPHLPSSELAASSDADANDRADGAVPAEPPPAP